MSLVYTDGSLGPEGGGKGGKKERGGGKRQLALAERSPPLPRLRGCGSPFPHCHRVTRSVRGTLLMPHLQMGELRHRDTTPGQTADE